MAGGEPVRIPLDRVTGRDQQTNRGLRCSRVARKQGRYRPNEVRCASRRQNGARRSRARHHRWLLLRDAYNLRKPILGICYGLQILNVFRGGTLLQHIESTVNHEAGKEVPIAHTVEVDAGSRLSQIVVSPAKGKHASVAVNSSHHQSAEEIGDGLRVVARCPQDRNHRSVRGNGSRSFRPGSAMAPGTFRRR